MTRGASPGVARFLSADGIGSTMGQYSHTSQIAPCGHCGAHLEFTTGTYGQTLELCPTLDCPNHAPHAPIRAHDAPLIASKARKVRNDHGVKPHTVKRGAPKRGANGAFVEHAEDDA